MSPALEYVSATKKLMSLSSIAGGLIDNYQMESGFDPKVRLEIKSCHRIFFSHVRLTGSGTLWRSGDGFHYGAIVGFRSLFGIIYFPKYSLSHHRTRVKAI